MISVALCPVQAPLFLLKFSLANFCFAVWMDKRCPLIVSSGALLLRSTPTLREKYH